MYVYVLRELSTNPKRPERGLQRCESAKLHVLRLVPLVF